MRRHWPTIPHRITLRHVLSPYPTPTITSSQKATLKVTGVNTSKAESGGVAVVRAADGSATSEIKYTGFTVFTAEHHELIALYDEHQGQ